VFVPKCLANGEYAPLQCWGSTGQCWCVNSEGEEIKGTSKYQVEGFPNCEEDAAKSDAYSPTMFGVKNSIMGGPNSLPPPWTYDHSIPKPAEKVDMGTYTALFYSPEQQKSLMVNKYGVPIIAVQPQQRCNSDSDCSSHKCYMAYCIQWVYGDSGHKNMNSDAILFSNDFQNSAMQALAVVGVLSVLHLGYRSATRALRSKYEQIPSTAGEV